MLFARLRKIGTPEYLVMAIESLYERTSYTVEGCRFVSHRGLKQGCPLSPLLFALFISDLDVHLERNQSGGVVLGRRKLHCLAFADDIAVLAPDAAALKDMIKSLHGFERRKELVINVEKTQVVTFSKGSKSSGVEWKVEGRIYQEVKVFNYLGVTFQQNGKFTTHHKVVSRKANRRATEVWSLAERLFPNQFYLRMRMFEALVKPIILYASEVTGFEAADQYEIIQRRYAKWTLGLPKQTRTAVVERECSLQPVAIERLSRALKYLSKDNSSDLVQIAKEAEKARNHLWWKTAGAQMESLGWNAADAFKLIVSDPSFASILTERAKDQYHQKQGCDLERIFFYNQWSGPPPYLTKEGYKTVARLRCGAESWDSDKWRENTVCRVCRREPETVKHIVGCAGISLHRLSLGEGGELHRWKIYLDKRPKG